MRKRIFEIIEKSNGQDLTSTLYDAFYGVVILLSLIPLGFKTEPEIFVELDYVLAGFFILDYLLRFLTADFKYGKKSWKPFLHYPLSFMAIMDLLAILPSLHLINEALRLVRLVRFVKVLRVMRIFKTFRYSRNFKIVVDVLRDCRESLLAVVMFALWYILISALIIFHVEPETFDSFFDALYWATISLTAVGYGDLYPVSVAGRVVTMVSSLFGIAIIALPSGIITAGFMQEVQKLKSTEE